MSLTVFQSEVLPTLLNPCAAEVRRQIAEASSVVKVLAVAGIALTTLRAISVAFFSFGWCALSALGFYDVIIIASNTEKFFGQELKHQGLDVCSSDVFVQRIFQNTVIAAPFFSGLALTCLNRPFSSS